MRPGRSALNATVNLPSLGSDLNESANLGPDADLALTNVPSNMRRQRDRSGRRGRELHAADGDR